MVLSREGYAYRFSIDEIPSTGIRSKGVKAMNLAKDDAPAFACAVSTNHNAVVFITASGTMKRLHMDDIPVGSRPARGVLICKKQKRNPSVLKYVKPLNAGDMITISAEGTKTVKAADIPFKQRDSGFSAVLALNGDWEIEKGIEECRIIDKPADADDTVHADIEQTSLFDE